MNIAVLGTGMVGRAIAAKLHEKDNTVFMGTRDVAAKKQRTANNETEGGDDWSKAPDNSAFNNWHDDHSNIELRTFADAAKDATIVFNCSSGLNSLKVLALAGAENLNGKILVDIANPLDFSNGMPPTLNPTNTDSLAEQIQAAYPNLKVVKTLNTMNGNLMVNPSMIDKPHNVFVSGNDDDAKATVKELLHSFGWEKDSIIDLGNITTARGAEMILPMWLNLYGVLGTPEFNFHIQRK